MNNIISIRSVSFDTSFLLSYKQIIDQVINKLFFDRIPCFVTSTVVSELEQLKIWGRITNKDHKVAIKRWKKTHASIIDFKNRFLSDTFARECMISMKKHHGVDEANIINDCNILVSSLKNGVDLFLSEDFHFTSKITEAVIDDIKNAACTEFHQMCDSMLYSIDAKTFLMSYDFGRIDLDVARSMMKSIRKQDKLFKK